MEGKRSGLSGVTTVEQEDVAKAVSDRTNSSGSERFAQTKLVQLSREAPVFV